MKDVRNLLGKTRFGNKQTMDEGFIKRFVNSKEKTLNRKNEILRNRIGNGNNT